MRQTLAQRAMLSRRARLILDCGHPQGNMPPVKVGSFTACCDGCVPSLMRRYERHLFKVAKKGR